MPNPTIRPSSTRYYGEFYKGSQDPYHSHNDFLPKPKKQRSGDYNNERDWSSHSSHSSEIHHCKRNHEDYTESSTYRWNDYESERDTFPSSERNYYSSHHGSPAPRPWYRDWDNYQNYQNLSDISEDYMKFVCSTNKKSPTVLTRLFFGNLNNNQAINLHNLLVSQLSPFFN